MAKAQFNNRQKNISRVIRTQRLTDRDKIKATGKFVKFEPSKQSFPPQK